MFHQPPTLYYLRTSLPACCYAYEKQKHLCCTMIIPAILISRLPLCTSSEYVCLPISRLSPADAARIIPLSFVTSFPISYLLSVISSDTVPFRYAGCLPLQNAVALDTLEEAKRRMFRSSTAFEGLVIVVDYPSARVKATK